MLQVRNHGTCISSPQLSSLVVLVYIFAFCHIVGCDICMLDSGLHRMPAGIAVRALLLIDLVECKALLDPTVHAHHLRFPLKQRNSCMGFALHDFREESDTSTRTSVSLFTGTGLLESVPPSKCLKI